MLRVVPKNKSWFAVDPPLLVLDGDQPVAEVLPATLTATLRVGSTTYAISCEGFLSNHFTLEANDLLIAEATKPLFKPYAIQFTGAKSYELRTRLFSRKQELLDGESVVGSVHAVGLFSREKVIDLPAEITLPEQLFVYWLCEVTWRKQRRSGD